MNRWGWCTPRTAFAILSVAVFAFFLPLHSSSAEPVSASTLEKELLGATKDEVTDRLGLPRYNRTHLDDPTGSWYYILHDDPVEGVEVVDPVTGKKCCEIRVLFKDRKVVAVTFGY